MPVVERSFQVVATDPEWPPLTYEEEELSPVGAEVVMAQCRTEDEVIAACGQADGVLVEYSPFTARVMDALPRLKIICEYGIGVDNIDVDAATERGICVGYVPDYCVDEVSDHAFSLLLTCGRQIVRMNQAVRARTWSFEVAKPLFRLRGQTVGVVAFGKIAKALATKAKAYGFRVLVHDPYVPGAVLLEQGFVPASLKEIIDQADFISLHAPLTAETRHLIGERELRKMKPTAYLINTSRGGLVDEQALHRALKEGWIAGAGLDVLQQEPPDWDNPLLSQDNVIFTPHAAFYSERALEDVRRGASREVARALQGQWPVNMVNSVLREKMPAPKRKGEEGGSLWMAT